MEEEGADIIDLGGESTRPGSDPCSPAEERERVLPVLEAVLSRLSVPVSIDTRRAALAAEATRMGAGIINDVSAASHDPDMAAVMAESSAGVILMHMKGEPRTMQNNPEYDDVINEVRVSLVEAAEKVRRAGVKAENIILDPGIGFGKSLEDNYHLLAHLDELAATGYPLCVGLSRKSLIGRLYETEEDRLPGTLTLNMLAVEKGAAMIRVHDVRPHRLALDTLEMMRRVS
jgi:dihydropteroate synthase